MIAIFFLMTFFNIYLVPYLFIDYIEIFTLKYLIPFINFINKCKNNKRIININILPDDIDDKPDDIDDKPDNIDDKPDDKSNTINNSILYNIDLLNMFDTFNKNLLFYTMIENMELINDETSDEDNKDELIVEEEISDRSIYSDNDENTQEKVSGSEIVITGNEDDTKTEESLNETEDSDGDNEEENISDEDTESDNGNNNYLKEPIVILDKNGNTEDTDTNSDIIIVENIE